MATYYNITATYLSDADIVNSKPSSSFESTDQKSIDDGQLRCSPVGRKWKRDRQEQHHATGKPSRACHASDALQSANTIISFAQSGGGIVTFGLLPTSLTDSTLISVLQPVIPLKMDPSYGGCVPNDYPEMGVTNTSHPIATSLPAYFSFNGAAEWSNSGILPGMTSIASVSGTGCTNLNAQTSVQGVVVGNYGTARLVYLCPAYAAVYIYNSQNVRTGETEQLLEASLWWASKVRKMNSVNVSYSAI